MIVLGTLTVLLIAPVSTAPSPQDIPPDVDRLIRILEDDGSQSRGRAVIELGRLGPAAKRAVPVLIGALREPQLRYEVLLTLGAIGPDALPAAPAMIDLLDDKDVEPSDRGTAARALGKMGPAVLPAVLAVLQMDLEDFSRDGAGAFFSTIVREVGAPALPVLLTALRDTPIRQQVSLQGLQTLGADAAPAAPALVEFLTRNGLLRQIVVEAFRAMGAAATAAVPRLIVLVGHSDVEVRRAALQVLGAIGPGAAAAVPDLEALSARDTILAPAVAEALAKIRPTGGAVADGERILTPGADVRSAPCGSTVPRRRSRMPLEVDR